MSIADQIRELEDELEHYREENSRLRNDLSQSEDRIEDLEYDCEEMGKFIEYIDETHPELRTAYEASKILEGASP
jgi:predicted RNase H-like nuclease (RuvC/YqgF family)